MTGFANIERFGRAVASRLQSLRGSTRGTIAIEFAFIIPVAMFTLLGGLTTFEYFRKAERLESTVYTIADIASRYPSQIDDSQFDTLRDLSTALLEIDPRMMDMRIRSVRIDPRLDRNGQPRLDANGDPMRVPRVGWEYRSRYGRESTQMRPNSRLREDFSWVPINDSILMVDVKIKEKLLTDFYGDGILTLSENITLQPRYTTEIRHVNQP